MNEEEVFWQGINEFLGTRSEPIKPEYRAYYNESGLVTHYTALEFGTQSDNFILVSESDYAQKDLRQMQVINGSLQPYVKQSQAHEFRLKSPASGFTPDPIHANILHHDSD
jgi:hypothetical protein